MYDKLKDGGLQIPIIFLGSPMGVKTSPLVISKNSLYPSVSGGGETPVI